ncbi:Crp/Fnr family transcriptional regulator [Robertkochia aurantiaca]|uniref:Crp/Fnr family transcriptional regulator n=1 Tax=Robertkochia aurantiaca TaxID=2873700 RepID=UPI001CC9C73B|nr:Crp/Fnr family transcriptional regulator [Robertkochia sp. 3YJGBD-33]
MKENKLKEYLTSNMNIDESEIAHFIDSCQTKNVVRGEFLLMENQNCNHTFFVEKGLLRQYSIDRNGKEHILSFAPENWFVTDRETTYFGKPSVSYIQALEDSQVVLIDEDLIQLLSGKLPTFSNFNNRLLHNHIRHLHDRIRLLLSASAEERYLEFINMYPDIFLRVPQAMVASYLGITPESLSRVRKKLAAKDTEM